MSDVPCEDPFRTYLCYACDHRVLRVDFVAGFDLLAVDHSCSSGGDVVQNQLWKRGYHCVDSRFLLVRIPAQDHAYEQFEDGRRGYRDGYVVLFEFTRLADGLLILDQHVDDERGIGNQELRILRAVWSSLFRLSARMSRTVDRSSAPSLGESSPARSSTDFLPASLFITSVKLSLGAFKAESFA